MTARFGAFLSGWQASRLYRFQLLSEKTLNFIEFGSLIPSKCMSHGWNTLRMCVCGGGGGVGEVTGLSVCHRALYCTLVVEFVHHTEVILGLPVLATTASAGLRNVSRGGTL